MNALLLLTLLAVTAPLVPASRMGFIIGGRDARVGEFPWQGSLQVKGALADENVDLFDGHICGAALVSNTWVASAAHCVGRGPEGLDVILGLHKRGDLTIGAPVTYNIKRIISHPGWDGAPGGDDMAMIQLASPAKLNTYVKPIGLARSDQTFENQMCTISGWGVTREGLEGGPLAEVLQAAEVKVVPMTECEEVVPIVNDGHICVHIEDQRGACSGDSGGPLVCEGVLAGVTSFGIVGCFTSVPSVYARVAYFRTWIQEVSGV